MTLGERLCLAACPGSLGPCPGALLPVRRTCRVLSRGRAGNRTQFVELYPLRRELLLTPENECGQKKFICTTLRPTQMPYKELYDVSPRPAPAGTPPRRSHVRKRAVGRFPGAPKPNPRGRFYRGPRQATLTLARCADQVDNAAKFLSDFLIYEPLEKPTLLPDHVISPNTVLAERRGDCFDFSMTLCSMLIGAGYDAYVVCGYAPKRVCLADEELYECPEARKKKLEIKHVETVEERITRLQGETGYELKPIPDLTSSYDKRKAREEEERVAPKVEEEKGEDWDALLAGQDEADELHGIRVHCWVLILDGKRDILEESFYIEPATGTRYPVASSPYLAIESIWNCHNYWVNMQDCSNGIDHIRFDLSQESTQWEHIFLDHTRSQDAILPGQAVPAVEAGNGENAEADAEIMQLQGSDPQEIALDLPPSWCPKLFLPKSAFDTLAPGRKRIKLYYQCKLEMFADYSEPDGLVQRVTIYDDRERTVEREVREVYRFRKDKLAKRERFPQEGRVVEYFDKGRMPRGETPDGLKQLEYWTNEDRRVLDFYQGARIDGLVRREDRFGTKTIENFRFHDDLLGRRTIKYSLTKDMSSRFGQAWVPDNSCTDISKVKEMYEANPKTEADDDINQLKYMVQSGQAYRIEVDYQYTQCRVKNSRRVYHKRVGGNSEGPPDGLSMEELVQVDPYAKPPRKAQTDDDHKELGLRFQATIQNIREMDRNVTELMRNRSMDEEPNRIEVVTHVYDASRATGDEDLQEEVEEEEEEEFDPLKAFLPQGYSLTESGPLSLKDAEKVKNECLKNLKQRLVERKLIIENRLLEQQHELETKHTTFQRQKDQMEPAEIEKYEAEDKDARFKINILQMRLEKHNEDAFGKLNDLYAKLKTDARVSVLYSAEGGPK